MALAQVDLAKAQVAQTKELIDRLTIRAPKSGVIFSSSVHVGQFTDSAVPAMILGDLDKLQVRVFVNEKDASLVKPNSVAVAYVKDQSMPLRLVRIDPYMIPKGDERVLQIIYSFDKSKAFPVYVGQQVDVKIK